MLFYSIEIESMYVPRLFYSNEKKLFHLLTNDSAGMQRATSKCRWMQEVFVNWLLFSETITLLFRSVPTEDTTFDHIPMTIYNNLHQPIERAQLIGDHAPFHLQNHQCSRCGIMAWFHMVRMQYEIHRRNGPWVLSFECFNSINDICSSFTFSCKSEYNIRIGKIYACNWPIEFICAHRQ